MGNIRSVFDGPTATQDRLPTTPVECKIDLIALPASIVPPEHRAAGFDRSQQSVAEGSVSASVIYSATTPVNRVSSGAFN